VSAPRLIHLTTTDMSLDWLLRSQLEAFADAGYEVIGVSAPGPHVDSLRASGIEHVAVKSLTRSMSPLNDLRAMRELVGIFRRLRPDIVHTHDPKPGIMGRIAARAARVPVVVNTVHGLYALPEDGLVRRSVVCGLERVASAFSDAELLQNPEDLDVLRRIGVSHEKMTLLGNGVDLRRFDPARHGWVRDRVRDSLGIGPDTVVVGVVGRLVWEKGYRAIFEAARLLDDSNCVFVVVGPTEPGRSGAVDTAATASAEANGVRFMGRRDDMPDLYSAFDIYALASRREGYPRSAMEASAMGLPVVATDIRGCRQVVADGVTGTLVPVDDGPAMADALRELIRSPELRLAMGAAARRRAEQLFDDRRVVETTLRTYEWLLGRSPAGLATLS